MILKAFLAVITYTKRDELLQEKEMEDDGVCRIKLY